MGDMAMKTTNMILGLILALCAANTASAQLIINGAGEARDCYLSVKNGDQGRKTTIRDCEQALRNISRFNPCQYWHFVHESRGLR